MTARDESSIAEAELDDIASCVPEGRYLPVRAGQQPGPANPDRSADPLDDTLRGHSVGNLDEGRTVGTDHVVARVAIALRGLKGRCVH